MSDISPDRKLLITRQEAAALCSMSVRTFLKYVGLGKFPKPYISNPKGTGSRWSREAIEDAVKQPTL